MLVIIMVKSMHICVLRKSSLNLADSPSLGRNVTDYCREKEPKCSDCSDIKGEDPLGALSSEED